MTLEEQIGMIKESLIANPFGGLVEMYDTLLDLMQVLEELAHRVEHGG